jgi:hypothetical protein
LQYNLARANTRTTAHIDKRPLAVRNQGFCGGRRERKLNHLLQARQHMSHVHSFSQIRLFVLFLFRETQMKLGHQRALFSFFKQQKSKKQKAKPSLQDGDCPWSAKTAPIQRFAQNSSSKN